MGENQDRPCCFAFAFFGAFDLGVTLSVAAFFTFGSWKKQWSDALEINTGLCSTWAGLWRNTAPRSILMFTFKQKQQWCCRKKNFQNFKTG